MGVSYIRYFLDAIKSILNNIPFQTSSEGVDFELLYSFASMHGMSGMLGWCETAIADASKEIKTKIVNDRNQNIASEAVQEIVISAFLDEMEDCGMRALPLKGFYMKNLYPHPAMRTMSDTDILIEEEKMNDITAIMQKLGLKHHRDTDNESVFESPQLSVELHRKLIDDTKGRLRDYYREHWKFAVPASGKKYICNMTSEDFYIFAVNHMAKHYTGGGVGLRHMMDIYLLLQKDYDWEYINNEFDKLGVSKFANQVKTLSKIWFEIDCTMQPDKELWEFGNTILKSGSFGEKNERLIAAMHTSKRSGGKAVSGIVMLIRRVFPSLGHMETLFPIVKRHKWLYPVFWIRRAWDICFSRRSEIKYWSDVINVSETDVNQFEQKLERAGIPEDF